MTHTFRIERKTTTTDGKVVEDVAVIVKAGAATEVMIVDIAEFSELAGAIVRFAKGL